MRTRMIEPNGDRLMRRQIRRPQHAGIFDRHRVGVATELCAQLILCPLMSEILDDEVAHRRILDRPDILAGERPNIVGERFSADLCDVVAEPDRRQT